METELKLAPVSAPQAARVFADGEIAPHLAPARDIRMETTWYDTADGALRALGWTARHRLEDGAGVCTLKGPDDGLSRAELDCAADSFEEGIARLLARETLPEGVRAALARPLQSTCGARFTRRVALYRDEAIAFELSFDRGVLLCGGEQGPLCEMELELVEGTEEGLRAFGERLAVRHALPVCALGKATRARALAAPPVREVDPFFVAGEMLNYCIRSGYLSFRMDEDSRVHYGLTPLGAEELPRRFGVDFSRPCAAGGQQA